MNYLKAIPYLAAALALGAAIWWLHHWDAARLQARYDAGVAAEHARWGGARGAAIVAALSAAQAGTAASEAAADTARTKAGATAAATAAETQTNVESITHAYADQKPSPCPADGRPRDLPVRVLQQLDQARRSALGHP